MLNSFSIITGLDSKPLILVVWDLGSRGNWLDFFEVEEGHIGASGAAYKS